MPWVVGHPPEIAVAALTHLRQRRGRAPCPVRANDRPPLPAPVVEHHLPQLHEVAGQEADLVSPLGAAERAFVVRKLEGQLLALLAYVRGAACDVRAPRATGTLERQRSPN